MSRSIRIRDAIPEDVRACAGILRDWADDTPWFPHWYTHYEDRAFVARHIAENRVRVAMRPDGIAGFLVLEGQEVPCLYVGRGLRGRGIGAALIDDAKRLSPDGLELWCFQANLGAQKFYTREGFAEVERTDGARNAEKLPDMRFRWAPERPKAGDGKKDQTGKDKAAGPDVKPDGEKKQTAPDSGKPSAPAKPDSGAKGDG
ncbi:GNAT family N-acetyltransferase [Oceanomicrobium pacificus]|uniref:GNAT family N-acetyltransferase n=1 Tax=Oceanomicrobium pacificus TaxID=2692916 RepID=A0A6B0TST0_9RHOB|nr:GNAT family N-acetyltransferase [Oceanomicrobium pacificus]MXU64272.1 GNAT family N-acetyltransferase [Oceanomicrobium pacificus]